MFIHENSKKTAMRLYDLYMRKRNGFSIWDAYKNPSNYKVSAFNAIVWEAQQHNGAYPRIIGHNSQVFSCVTIWYGDPKGSILVYYTKDNKRFYRIKPDWILERFENMDCLTPETRKRPLM